MELHVLNAVDTAKEEDIWIEAVKIGDTVRIYARRKDGSSRQSGYLLELGPFGVHRAAGVSRKLGFKLNDDDQLYSD